MSVMGMGRRLTSTIMVTGHHYVTVAAATALLMCYVNHKPFNILATSCSHRHHHDEDDNKHDGQGDDDECDKASTLAANKIEPFDWWTP